MKTFTDTAGRVWRFRMTLGKIDDVLSVCGVDLLEPLVGEPPVAVRLRSDMRLMARVLGELMETDGNRELTVAELRAAFDGATKAAAWNAFVAEWTDFFREDGRQDVATAIVRVEALIDAAVSRQSSLVKAIELGGETASADALGTSPGSSASTLSS